MKRVSAALLCALLATACLQDHPLITPENAYDPKLALRSDSLARFDSVEILLVDARDTTLAIRLWEGRFTSPDTLATHLAGDGQTLVYIVRGYRVDRGQCFSERVSQEGTATVLMDTCARPDSVPVPVPVFAFPDLDFGVRDSTLSLRIGVTGAAAEFQLAASEDWIRIASASITTVSDTTVTVDVAILRSALPPGKHLGYLWLRSGGKTVDTAEVRAEVPALPALARIEGKVVDWNDSAPQPGLIVILDGTAPGVPADSLGAFSFDQVPLGSHVLRVSGEGRIGSEDSFTVAAAGPIERIVKVAPAAVFREVDLGWSLPTRSLALADGHAAAASSGFDAPGSVAEFPLDHPGPSMLRVFDQGNVGGDVSLPEYYEAGGMTGDGDALFIAYPDDSRLGRIGGWETQPQPSNVSIPFQPSGLLLDQDHLMALGRLADGTLALGDFRAADLALNRVDTLAGFSWDGVIPGQRGPKLAAGSGTVGSDFYYAVDGNSPTSKGRLLKIDKSDRKVEASVELPDGGLNDVAVFGDMIYVTSVSSSRKLIRVFDEGLVQTDSIAAGTNTNRIAFATEGNLRGCAFVTAEDNSILVIRAGSRQPVGRLVLPGNLSGQAVAVDGKLGKVLVADGSKLYIAEF